MRHRSGIAAGMTALAVGCIPSALADDHPHEKRTHATPHTHEQGGPRLCGSRPAHPSYHEHDIGGAGGGKAIDRQVRCGQEGTWGWDYTPSRHSGRGISLGGPHGWHHQVGIGSHSTDGTHPPRTISEAVQEHGVRE